MANNIKILVTGATGRTGVKVVDKLFNAGYEVYAQVRNEDKGKRAFPPGITLVRCDLKDYNAYDMLVRNMDVIVYAAAAPPTWFGKNTPKAIDYESVRQMAMAADNQNVKQFILISSMGVTHSFFLLKFFGNVLSWKFKGEHALRSTNLNYTIIRPGGLTDQGNNPEQLVFYQDDKIRINARISREEVAEIVLKCIGEPEVERVTFETFHNHKAVPRALEDRLDHMIADKARKPYSQVV